MNLIIPHPSIEQSEQTFLTAAVDVADIALTVMNNDGFSDNDYVIVGKLGEEKSE